MTFLLLIAISATAGLATAAAARRYPEIPAGGATTPVLEAAIGGSRRRRMIRRWARARRDPAVATGLALSIAFVAVVAGGLVLGVLAYLVRANDSLRSVDLAIAEWGFENASGFSDAAIEAVTQLGDTLAVTVLGLVLIAVEWRRWPSFMVAPFLLAVVLGDKLVTTAVKELIDRARPALHPIAETLGPSFPSGHSSTAAAFFAAAALVIGRGRPGRLRAILAGGAVAVAVAVACSRVLLGVHWLSDVIAGLALGWGWFALCAIAFGGRLLRFGASAERLARMAREDGGAPGRGTSDV